MTPPTHPLQEGGFDPLAMLRRSRGDGDEIRDIKLRMLWLRQRVPEARVTTEVVTVDAGMVVMSASIALPDGGAGAGHAASRIGEGDDLAALIETTELRAIGRALDILGYVVLDPPGGQAAAERAEPEPPDRAPTPITRERTERPERAPRGDAAAERPGDEPTPAGNPPGHVQAIRALRERGQRQQTRPEAVTDPAPERPDPSTPPPATPRPEPQRAAPTPADDADPELEDISWTAFWGWARSTYQLSSKVQLEELLGQPIGNKPPGEVRALLREHFDGAGTPDSE